ncbi:MAG: sugar-binding domain-containing protein [Candidatus Omnitrophota bacterium]
MNQDVISLNGSNWRLVGLVPGEGLCRHLQKTDILRYRGILARVPGDVHDDLQRAGRLPDLYRGMNGRRAKTVPTLEWWYVKSFRTPVAWRGMRSLLKFSGVDYAARVWLNGRELGRHEGAFTPFLFDVTAALRTGAENRLAIRLEPGPRAHLEKLFAQHGTGWPHHYAHETRLMDHTHWKSSTNTGWDFGIPIYTLGLWQDVTLFVCRDVYLSRLMVLPVLLPPYRRADLAVRVRLNSVASRPVRLRFSVTCDADPRAPGAQKELLARCRKGDMEIKTRLSLAEPRLWWPNGYGPQHLYRLEVTALDPDTGEEMNAMGSSFGIRDLRIADNPVMASNTHAMETRAPRPPDRSHYVPLTGKECLPMRKVKLTGKKLTPCRMVINGRSVFGKGGNWVPVDLLYGRVRRADYDRLIRQAAEANFTLFRIWGGGLIEKPEFYDLCDQYGILVFQEFPNGGCRPPEDAASLKVMERELGEVIPLVANHPCVVRYGFGNELYITERDSRQFRLTRRVCRKLDPTRPFFGPDPVCTIQRHAPHEFNPGAHYRLYNTGLPDTIGPVAPAEWTEFGAAGAARPATLRRIMPRKHLWPIRDKDPYWKYHHAFDSFGVGNWLAPDYYRSLFGPLPNLETEVWCSQFLQAEGLRYACQSHRRREWSRSACTIWSYNEPWPNAAHGCIVEHDGTPKMAYHFVRRAYAPLDVSAEYDALHVKSGAPLRLQLWVVNDTETVRTGARVRVDYSTLAGDVLHTEGWRIRLPVTNDGFECGRRGAVSVGCGEFRVPMHLAGEVILAQVSLTDASGRPLAGHTYVFGVTGAAPGAPPLQSLLNAPAARLRVEMVGLDDGAPENGTRLRIRVFNHGRVPALFVAMRCRSVRPSECDWSDNYFTLLGGESRKLVLRVNDRKFKRPLRVAAVPINGGRFAVGDR